MPLARLENFLKNLNGNTLYVDPNELDSSDSIENRGNSRLRPFKTIQRALIEAARFAYVPGTNNDLFDQTTILISPGTHFIDNRPGYWVDSSNILRDVNGAARTINEFNVSSNFDLTDPSNTLYIYNSHTGGVIVPKGTSIVAQDLRKTKIRPKYVPNPTNDSIQSASIFQLTGACYIYGFTIFDGDPIGKVYTDYSTNTVVPSFSHHKLTAFEYADDSNNIIKSNADTGHTDLENYYYKLSLGFGAQSSRSVIDGYNNFQPNVDENRIVGELGSGSIIITGAVSGNGVTGTTVITVTTQSPHNLAPLTPIIVSGLGQAEGPTTELEYNGNFIVAQVTSETEFTYLLPNVPTQTLNPSVVGSTVKVISDTVSSASPYIFNISLKSVYGMNGLHADGSRTTGFKSMVTAQFTGISLQKDDRAFTEYDSVSGAYQFQDNFGVDKFLHQSSLARYRPSWETTHIKASNDAFIQCVSIFGIGYAKQFVADAGGDQSITNSNSNFGQIALFSTGYKKDVLAKDNHAYITHILQPKEISDRVNVIRYEAIDATLTQTLSPDKTRVYFKDYTDLLSPPANTARGFTVGGAQNDVVYYKSANVEYGVEVANSYGVEYEVASIDTSTNILTLAGIGTTNAIPGISTGLSGRIESKNGILPDGLEAEKLYNVRLTGGSGIKLYDNLSNAENDISVVNIKNQVGVGVSNLKFVSRVNEKSVGDIGHPIQWDSVNLNWYVGVNPESSGADDFFSTLSAVTGPSLYVKRKVDSRTLANKAYRFRIVVPKEAPSASDITPGFVIQRASNSLNSLLYQAESADLISATSNELSTIRNKGAIIDAWYDAGTVTVITSKPHNLNVGDDIKIYNLKSSAEPAPVGLGTGTGFNGEFIVASVVNELRFTYTITRDPGTITVGVSTTPAWLTVRDCAQTSDYRVPPYTVYDANRNSLPYFTQKDLQNDYQVYDVETISKYEEGISDGVYYVTLNSFKNAPTISPFNTNEYKLSQSIERFYPAQDADNPISDPDGTITKASRSSIGVVDVNDIRNNSTKEVVSTFLNDINYGKAISGITTYYDDFLSAGIATITTSKNHGFGGISRITLANGSSGFVDGAYYDIPLCGGSGEDATCSVTVSGGVVSTATIQNFGSGYVVGDTLTARGVPGSSNTPTVVVSAVNTSASSNDTVQILGCAESGNNGTFIIKSLTKNTLTVYNNSAKPETTEQGVVCWGGPGYQLDVTPDGAVYDSATNTTTISTQQATNFTVGNKVIFDDQTIGISTVSNVLGITSFTVRGDAGSANRVYGFGFSAIAKDANSENENLSSRHFALYSGYKSSVNQSISVSDVNFLVSSLYGLQKGDIVQVNAELMLVTKISGGEIYVKRGVFGSRATTHENQSAIKKVSAFPVEARRNSILRASGHTFEYVGFGPGNYSTGMPTNQDRILTDTEILTSQSLTSRGGIVVYTGMNSNGEFFIGKTKFDAVTGKQTDVAVPVEAADSGTSVDTFEANTVIVNDLLDASTAIANLYQVTIESDVSVVGLTTYTNDAAATSSSEGAVHVVGGIAVEKNIVVGDSATIDSVQIGITSATTIDTSSDNLYLDSAGGSVVVADDLRVTGIVTVTSPSAFHGHGTIPIGGIIMWSGSIADIAGLDGWELCDGNNGTPDLTDRFVVGAGNAYAVDDFGGSANAILVSHSHTAESTSTVTDPQHSHGFDGGGLKSLAGDAAGNDDYASGGGTTGNASTGITVATTTTISDEGVSGLNANLPPFFALAYIMRTA